MNDKELSRFGLASAGAAGTVAMVSSPVFAAAPTDVTTAVSDITATGTSLSGLAVALLTVVLTVLGVAYGIGYGKKIMSKG